MVAAYIIAWTLQISTTAAQSRHPEARPYLHELIMKDSFRLLTCSPQELVKPLSWSIVYTIGAQHIQLLQTQMLFHCPESLHLLNTCPVQVLHVQSTMSSWPVQDSNGGNSPVSQRQTCKWKACPNIISQSRKACCMGTQTQGQFHWHASAGPPLRKPDQQLAKGVAPEPFGSNQQDFCPDPRHNMTKQDGSLMYGSRVTTHQRPG